MRANGKTLDQRASVVAQRGRQFHQIVFPHGQIFTESAVLMYAIKRDVFAAVGFPFPAGRAIAAWDTGNNAVAAAFLYTLAGAACLFHYAANFMAQYARIRKEGLASRISMDIRTANAHRVDFNSASASCNSGIALSMYSILPGARK